MLFSYFTWQFLKNADVRYAQALPSIGEIQIHNLEPRPFRNFYNLPAFFGDFTIDWVGIS